MNVEVSAKLMEKGAGKRGSKTFSPYGFTKFKIERRIRGKRRKSILQIYLGNLRKVWL